MDRDKIIGLFTSGKYQGGAETKAALHDIVNTYPYFQLAQVLYARQVYDDNDTDITNQVKIASAYAPNRRAMYMLFKSKVEVKTETKIEKEIKVVEVPVKEEVKYSFVYQSATTPAKEKEDAYLSEVVMAPIAEDKSKEKKDEISPVSETFLEREILGAVANARMEKAMAEAESVSVPEVQEITDEQAIPLVTATTKSISASETHSFEEWLKLLPSVDVKEGNIEEKKVPKKAADIIQQFLENQPRISKPKAEFFSPAKAARNSVTEDDSLVSETLAKILEAQGNHHKAIRAYETLMLQIPQKKAYFAARIKEIRKIIDSGNTKK